MNKKIRVLILLATHNGEKFICEQLTSILNQKEVDIEVLVSDDLSSDNTLNIINKFKEENYKIDLLPSNKKFGSASPNFFRLIKESNTKNFDYIAFSDQDDIWFDDKIISSIKLMKKYNAEGFSSDIFAYWPKINKKKLIKKSFKQKKYDYLFEGPGPGCTQVLSVNSFNAFKNLIIHNYDSLNSIDYHDWLIYAFYRYNDIRWHISNKPKMLYRQHNSNQIGANNGLRQKLNRIKDIKNNWYKHQIHNIFKILSDKNFNECIKSNYLIFKPFSLRRKKTHSIIIWILILFGALKR